MYTLEDVYKTFPSGCTEDYKILRAFEMGKQSSEKQIAELKEKLKTAYRKGMRHMAKALKDYDRTDGAWTDYFEHTVDKVLQREQLNFEEYGTLAEQLTKAKNALKKFVDFANGERTIPVKWITETEQFLNEVEK